MSNKNIDLTEFEKEIIDILDEYKEEAKEAIAQTLPLVGKEAAQELKATSPKKSGKYANGWKAQLDTRKRSKDRTAIVVFNKSHYYLTHLLEFGHAKVNGGRVAPIPHIAKAQENAENKTIERIKDKLERLK